MPPLHPFRPKPEYPTYDEARAIVRDCHVRTARDYYEARRTNSALASLPPQPQQYYQHAGAWIDWPDFLGSRTRWNRTALAAFVRDLIAHAHVLSPSELAVLLREARVWNTNAPTRAHADLLRRLMAMPTLRDSRAELEAILDGLEGRQLAGTACTDIVRSDAAHLEGTLLGAASDDADDADDARLDPAAVLDALQCSTERAGCADASALAFFEAKALSKLWQSVMVANTARPALDDLARYKGGAYAERLRDRFMEQWNGAARISPPAGYHFGEQPNLMQRLLAYRLKTERRIGNWSAPGAGKTLGAILASRVVDSRLTLVVYSHNTREGWEKEITKAWPDSVVIGKDALAGVLDRSRHTYLLLNHETFQQPNAQQFVEQLLAEHRLDMIVLDELHRLKHRETEGESKRRRLLKALLDGATARNPALYVLGMTATPVVNVPSEAASLLEMILGTPQDDIDTRATLDAAIRVHERLVIHGVRYRPTCTQRPHERIVSVAAAEFADELAQFTAGFASAGVLALEQILLRAKLPLIVAETRPGTVIYTEYVRGMVCALRRALVANGLRVAQHTGASKDGLATFKAREADVLIASSTLREGIDGLQDVSSRLIIASLPWTHAYYEQLVGRLHRQGQQQQVEVVIPQAVLSSGAKRWSWDELRLARVHYKKTLADAAVDGVIPAGELETEEQMLAHALNSLRNWIESLERGEPAA